VLTHIIATETVLLFTLLFVFIFKGFSASMLIRLILLLILALSRRVKSAQRHANMLTANHPSGQVVHTYLPLPPSSIIWYQLRPGGKQAHGATL